MATETNGQTPAPAPAETTTTTTVPTPASAAAPSAQPANKEKDQKPAAAAAEAPPAEKKLTGAELKKKAKEEKAARRAQAKLAAGPPAGGPAGPAANGGGKPVKGGKADGNAAPAQQQHQQGQQQQNAKPVAKSVVKDNRPKVPEPFSHLSMAKRIDMKGVDKDLHPAILALGQQMSAFALRDSITRLEATLAAFQAVIEDYTTPMGSVFSRHFTTYVLNPQIEYLSACRPMCFSMGNAVRWLKLQISKIDIDVPDADAKALLCESITTFISERVQYADYLIVETAANMIQDGEVVLTYSHHQLVEKTILAAKERGTDFDVVLVDDPYHRAGVHFAKRLSDADIPVSYSPDLGALRTQLRGATKVFVAAEAMFSNGAMYAQAGTCDIAAAATDLGIPVHALCESINFTERVSIDSLTYNEIDPERFSEGGFRLLFDTTREKFISSTITELGEIQARGVPAILRKLEDL